MCTYKVIEIVEKPFVRQHTEQIARLHVDNRHTMNMVQTQLADCFEHRRVRTD